MTYRKRALTHPPTSTASLSEIRAQIEAAVGEAVVFGGASDLPPEVERRFLESVLAYETAEEKPLIEHLRQSGFDPPPPSAALPEQIAGALWKLIEALARIGVYLHHTDHLSDTELYRYLWDEQLHEPIAIVEYDPGAWHVDPTLSGSEESRLAWLTYYANDDEREECAGDLPGLDLPKRRPLPFQRDRLLPRPGAERER